MSKTLHLAPLAVASDGSVLLNLAQFDVAKHVEALFDLALQQRGAVFIGVAISAHEVAVLREHADDAFLQAAFGVAGRRQKRARQK